MTKVLLALAACLSATAAQALPGLPYGTPVPLETTQQLTSRDALLGEEVWLRVTDDVVAGGQVVIPRGTRALAEVCNVKPRGAFGVPGRVETRLLYVRVGERMVRLNGRLLDRGKPGGAGAVAAGLLIAWPAAAIVTGTSGRIPAGTRMIGYLDEDVAATDPAGGSGLATLRR